MEVTDKVADFAQETGDTVSKAAKSLGSKGYNLPPVNPFDSEAAVQHSQYFYMQDGRPVSEGGPASPPDLFESAAVAAFRGFVQNPQFSCVDAKSAVAHESVR